VILIKEHSEDLLFVGFKVLIITDSLSLVQFGRSLEHSEKVSVMEKREYLYKILVIGDNAVGKSSIVKRYVHNFFTERYKATIGVDFAMKVLNWDQNTIVRLQLWDIAGQERSRQLNRVYYNGASGCITVYDITRPDTLEAVAMWKDEIDKKVQLPDGKPIPCVLFANKCDLIDNSENEEDNSAHIISKEIMDEYSKKFGFIDWFLTSAKENTNLDVGARRLVSKILENKDSTEMCIPARRTNDTLSLKNSTAKSEGSGCCRR